VAFYAMSKELDNLEPVALAQPERVLFKLSSKH
jgi:hypothetical protein